MSINVASRLASIALTRAKLLKGYKTYEKAPPEKKGGYYIYSGSKQPAVQVWTGGGGQSYGGGAGDRLRNVPETSRPLKKPRFSLEDILDIVKEYKQGYSSRAAYMLALRALQQYKQMGLYDTIRPQTGELTYNPIFQTYNERRTWLKSYPYWWNTLNPRYQQERIFRHRREHYARQDFYVKNIDRLIRILPEALEPYIRNTDKGGQRKKYYYGAYGFQLQTPKRKKIRKKGWSYRTRYYRNYVSKKGPTRQTYRPRYYKRRF